MTLRISFPGGTAVNAELGSHLVRTDQPRKAGGGGSAPAPFDLFLASIGTCAGFYALRFCQQRGIETGDLGIRLEATRDSSDKRVEAILINVELPFQFPDKYRNAIVRAIDQCAVKQHILEPPEFAIEVDASKRQPASTT